MKDSLKDYILYRIERAKETYKDAELLAEKKRWNSAINRLYYAAFYAVIALLLKEGINSRTHRGAKNAFNQYFVKTGAISQEYGRLYSQLFTWRQKGDYDDLFNFTEESVKPFFNPVQRLITKIETILS